MSPQALLVQIARSQIGRGESPPGSNKGPQIQPYFDADNYDPREDSDLLAAHRSPLADSGYPWCACFVSWCVQELVRQLAREGRQFTSPFFPANTAAAYGLEAWGRKAGCRVLPAPVTPQLGDLVTYTFSHCGIVTSDPVGPVFTAVEGNTNTDGGREGYLVAEQRRVLARIRAIIRLPSEAHGGRGSEGGPTLP